MSIIQQIREKYAAVGIGFIALSLIGFILMDSTQSGSGGGVDPSDAIGEINGSKISYATFAKKASSIEDMQQMNGRAVDEDLRQQINSEVWRQMVEKTLLDDEYAKLGIVVTDKEFNDLLFGNNPPDFLKQQFTNKETGMYDAVAARQAILDMKKAKNNPNTEVIEQFYLEPLVENTKRVKYNSLLQNSAFAPKFLVEKTFADNASIASMQFVSIPYSNIADSVALVTDAMIMDYVKARPNQFKQEEAVRTAAYVSFPFNASATDSADVFQALQSLKQEFIITDDAASFVNRNASALPFADAYFSKERIQIAQKDSIIAAGLGSVYGPYVDGDSYVMSRVMSIKTLPDSVKARHILISLVDGASQQPIMSDSMGKVKIDSIENAIKGGASFANMATQYSSDPGSAAKGGDLGYFASGMMVKEFNDFCFEKPKGSMGVVKSQFGYHLIEVTDQKNFVPAYKIAYLSKNIDPSMETVNEALNAANVFAGNSRNMKAFDENVAKENLNKLVIAELRENDYNVMGLGNNRRLVKDIFEGKVGNVLDPVELDNQYVVITITGAEDEGLMSVVKARPMVESVLRNQVKAGIMMKKMGVVKSLQEVASGNNSTVLSADSISFASPILNGVGFEPKVGGFAFFKSNLNKISEPIEGNSGVFVIQPSFIGASQSMGGNLDELRASLTNQSKSSAIGGSLQALRLKGTIVDKRSKFL